MEKVKIVVDGKEEELVISLDDDYKNDGILLDHSLDDTAEIVIDGDDDE